MAQTQSESILLSIIIPVYNIERKLLKKCFESIKTIPTKKVQVIVVNDGSQNDKTYEIKEEVEEFGFLYIWQENKGVSAARNTGLKFAVGKFIMFVDGDDTIDGTILNDEYLNRYDDNETILFDYYCIDLDTKKKNLVRVFDAKPTKNGNKKILQQDLIELFITTKNLNECWGKLFSTKLIREKKLCFPETLRVGEDTFFNGEYFLFAKDVVYCDQPLYCYSRTENSATRKGTLGDLFNCVAINEIRRSMVGKLDASLADDLYACLDSCLLEDLCRNIMWLYIYGEQAKEIKQVLKCNEFRTVLQKTKPQKFKAALQKFLLCSRIQLPFRVGAYYRKRLIRRI